MLVRIKDTRLSRSCRNVNLEEGNKQKMIQQKSNLEVIDEVSENINFIKALERRRVKLVGHLVRHKEFLTNIIKGKILGKTNKVLNK